MGSDPFTLSQSGERDDRVSCLLYCTQVYAWYQVSSTLVAKTLNVIYTCLALISIPVIHMAHTSPKLVLEPMLGRKRLVAIKVLKGTQYEDMARYENFKKIQYQN